MIHSKPAWLCPLKYDLKMLPSTRWVYCQVCSWYAAEYTPSMLPSAPPSMFSSRLAGMLSRTLPIALDGTLPHQQNRFQSLGASRSMWEEAECKLRRVNFRRESDPRRAIRPAFGVTGISDDWYRSTMGAVLISLGAAGTVAQPMRESQTDSERCLGSYGYWFEGLQALSENLRMYTSNKNTLHIWCIDYCSLSTSKWYYSTQHPIQHSIVCIAILRRTKENGKGFKNTSRWNRNNNPTNQSNDINRT